MKHGVSSLNSSSVHFLLIGLLALLCVTCLDLKKKASNPLIVDTTDLWLAPDIAFTPKDEYGDLIHYGKELITSTSSFIGPNGSVSTQANGMNCQNCHLEAGTKPFGNNFGSVASTYPKYRHRSGSVETIEKRINDCFQRSLNGAPLNSSSKEMRALVAYITWLGKDVSKDAMAKGSGLYPLPWLERAADPRKGKAVYIQKCQICHASSGEGQRISPTSNYIYPPLNGPHSFTTAAGLFRISNSAKFIYTNMPQVVTYASPMLTIEQSWDVAAYILTLPHPTKQFPGDWPDLKAKPIDYPFGPYADTFSEQQHKLGPFPPIEEHYTSR
jgi:thiosulfate dehydrogenase